jgi:hypothetical protein
VKAGIFKHPKSVSHGVCAGESGDFQQLRSISHGLCAGESGEFSTAEERFPRAISW